MFYISPRLRKLRISKNHYKFFIHIVLDFLCRQILLTEDARVLIKNKYPYYYESDVTNWVLWLRNQNEGDEDIKSWIGGHEQLRKYDLIVYENSQQQKSVKGIRHLQILARETTDKKESFTFIQTTTNYKLYLYS